MVQSGYVYFCSAGESFDSVAREIYGEENHAVHLLCANPEHSTKLVFAGGEVLYLPVVQTQREAAVTVNAPWRE